MAKMRIGARGRRLRRLAGVGLTATVAAGLLAGCSPTGSDTITVYAPADGADYVRLVAAQCEIPGKHLQVMVLPKSADDQRLQLARRLTGNDHTLDVMGMDVNWTAEFAEAGWALPLPDDLAARAEKSVLAGPLKTARWEDQLYAMPAWTNTELLWYRKDALEKVLGHDIGKKPPQLTWDEVLKYAARSYEIGGPSWIEPQTAQYEGLVVWFNSLLESAGGAMVGPDGKTVTLTDTPEHRAATVKALTVMKAVATAPGHDPSITQLNEGSARLNMESGKAIFEINWPFVFAGMQQNAAAGAVSFLPELVPFNDLLNPAEGSTAAGPTTAQLRKINDLTRAKFDFAPYPSMIEGKPAKTTIGGINFAVAKTSQHKEAAFAALDCLTDESAERTYAIKGGTPPVQSSLYDDPEFVKAYPMASLIRDQLQANTTAVRPITPNYVALSTRLQAELAPIGSWDPETKADQLTDAAEKAMNGEGLVP